MEGGKAKHLGKLSKYASLALTQQIWNREKNCIE